MAKQKAKLNKYGWKKDKPDFRDLKYSAPRHLIGSLPPEVNLMPMCPPVYDQNSLGSCHDDRTEVLTDKGWKLFSDITTDYKLASVDTKSKNLIFENPTRLIRFHYSGNMHYCKQQNLDFAVTPDHKMVVRPWDEKNRTLSNEYTFVSMDKVGWYVGLLDSVKYNGDDEQTYIIKGVDNKKVLEQRNDKPVPMDLWLRFLGIYLAEGTVLKEKYKIQIAAVKSREKNFIRNILANLQIDYTELKDRFTINNYRLYSALENLGLKGVKAPFKFVPSFVFTLSGKLIKNLLLGHFMGDGCIQNENKCNYPPKCHYTSSFQLAEDLQRLIFLSGDWSNISVRPPRTSTMKDGRIIKGKYPEYRVSVLSAPGLSIDRKKYTEIKFYEGEVFCAEVPTYHTLVTRRNGKILISGNCTGQALAGDVHFNLIKQDPSKAFQPSALFIYYNERVLENSVNDDSGAEIRDGIKSLVRWGVCPEEYWPYVVGKFKNKPTAQAYKHALPHRIDKYMRVTQREEDIKACLADEKPIVFGFMVYESFESEEVAKTGIVDMPKRHEKDLGGHATMIVSYSDINKRFIVRNSWGARWGMNGYFSMPYDYVLDPELSNDFWCIQHMSN